MPFEVGQVYESVDGEKMVVVVETRSEGREAKLRILGGGDEEWSLWSEFQQQRWHLLGPRPRS